MGDRHRAARGAVGRDVKDCCHEARSQYGTGVRDVRLTTQYLKPVAYMWVPVKRRITMRAAKRCVDIYLCYVT